MAELHWHPFYEEWVVITPARQARPNLPKTSCPFCPGSPKVPAQYEAIALPNDFPSLSLGAGEAGPAADPFYPSQPAQGVCEVVLYSSVHDQTLATLTPLQMDKVIALWTERYQKLGSLPEIQHVFIFENRGEPVGATIPHPHGQIYAYGFTPPRFEKEAAAQRRYLEQHKSCLGCAVAAEEIKHPERLVTQNQHWIASVPYYCRFPFEVQILPQRHAGCLTEIKPEESRGLNEILRNVARRYDALFGFPLPYMMWQHAKPTDGGEHPWHHFRVTFVSIQRAADKLKYFASVESASGTYLTDLSPEAMAEKLRKAGD